MPDATPAKKKPVVSPLLIVLVVILVLGVGALLVDMAARNGAEAAYKAISEKLPSEAEMAGGADPEPLTQADVEALMGRAPDGAPADADQELTETFTWRGPMNKYQVHVVYAKGATPLVLRATLNQPPE